MKHIKLFDKFFESLDNELTKKEMFDLTDVNSIEDVDTNVNIILSQYSVRNMASIQVEGYLKEIGDLGKQYIVSNGIKSREDLKAFCNKKQTILRKGKNKEKQAFRTEIKNQNTEKHLNNIIDMALKQSDDMDKRIENM